MIRFFIRSSLLFISLVFSTIILAQSGPDIIGGLTIAPSSSDVPDTIQNGTQVNYSFVIENTTDVDEYYYLDQTSGDATAKYISGTCVVGGTTATKIPSGGSCTFSVSITAPLADTPATPYPVMRLATRKNQGGTMWSVTYATTGTPPPPSGDLEFNAVSGKAMPASVQVNTTHDLQYTLVNEYTDNVSYTLADQHVTGITVNWGNSTCSTTGSLAPTQSCTVDMTFLAPSSEGTFTHDVLIATNQANHQQFPLHLSTQVISATVVPIDVVVSGLPSGEATVNVSLTSIDGAHKCAAQALNNGTHANFCSQPAGQYTVTAADYQDYVPTLSNPYTITASQHEIDINYTQNAPITSLPGWPSYLAMGNISVAASTFATKDNKQLDVAYTYNTINGNASIGQLILNSKKAGTGWAKVYSLFHDGDSFSSPSSVIPFIVYYTDDSGSASGSGFGNDGSYVPAPYGGGDDHESYGNLTYQYVNYFNFLGIILDEAKSQTNFTASIGLNPDLLGGLLQRSIQGGSSPETYLDKNLGSVRYALSCSILGKPPAGNSHACPAVAASYLINPDFHAFLKKNYTAIWSAIQSSDGGTGETGKAYLNSFNIFNYFALRLNDASNTGNCEGKCTDVSYGWHLNAWLAHGNANNIPKDPAGEGQYALSYLQATGLFQGEYRADFSFFDKYEADGLTPSGLSNGYFWDASTWSDYITFISTIVKGPNGNDGLNTPTILWQISASHIPEDGETNFPYQIANYPWAANRVDDNTNYIFGNHFGVNLTNATNSVLDTNIFNLPHAGGINTKYCSGTGGCTSTSNTQTIRQALGLPDQLNQYQAGHLAEVKNAGIVAILWGGGDGSRTTSGYCFISITRDPATCETAWDAPSDKIIYNYDNGWFQDLMTNYLDNVRQ
jgi:hypothetical protein